MLTDIVEVRPLDDYQLYLRFEDGVEGVVGLKELIPFEGIFAELRERSFFERVRVNPELGAIYWPNGADLDSDVLYSSLTGRTLPSFEAKKA
ncbi:MAG TPA: DUF2442 domain-containing protein [Bryobacteraceae bacterium]|jgi:hypothetical protein|nr:DUF2442 domain-containing protein [Bryobacteraceae bacterium]